MEARFHTHDYDGLNRGKAKIFEVGGSTVLSIEDGKGNLVDVYGPPTAKDAFDQIAKLFNDAHKNEAATATAGDWISWTGGECPVPRGTKIDAKDEDGFVWEGVHALSDNCVSKIFWLHTAIEGCNIAAYRLVK